ncbi:MAG: hypothetical protein LKF33_07940 [Prevotella sp.]|jgi:hypothetical protein|nr:hypothetical protein [Prevotella sp.]
MKRISIIFLLLLTLSATAFAQRKQVKPHKTNTAVRQASPEDSLFRAMLPSTAKVMFIDSLVVDKDSFLSYIPLNKESGSLYSKDGEVNGYMNEFRNRAYFSEEKDSVTGRKIYTYDKLGNKWSEPMPLEGVGKEFKSQNYPFVMSDGITLFFSAKGRKSMGGYDIFTTMFDSEKGKFYAPENYGLPFNSKANDYLLAIDDLDTLGWLVSDRYLPEGKVCIYTFVPTNPRQSFEADNLPQKELEGYARLTDITDTWDFGNHKQALERLHRMMARNSASTNPDAINFVINDAITYRDIQDFKSATNRQLFLELNGDKGTLNNNEQKLALLRDQYASASSSEKRQMQQEILRLEKEVEQQRTNVHEKEKKIRNSENILLRK